MIGVNEFEAFITKNWYLTQQPTINKVNKKETKEVKEEYVIFKNFEYICFKLRKYQPSKSIKEPILNQHIKKVEGIKTLDKWTSYLAIDSKNLTGKVTLPNCYSIYHFKWLW